MIGGLSPGFELVVTMGCTDGREVVLKNAGDGVYSHGLSSQRMWFVTNGEFGRKGEGDCWRIC